MATRRTVDASANIHLRGLSDEHSFEGPMELLPTNITVNTSRYDEAARVSTEALVYLRPDVATTLVQDSETPVLEVFVNDTTVGTGLVNSISVASGEVNQFTDAQQRNMTKLSVTAFDVVRQLNQNSHTATYDQTPAVQVVDDVMDSAGIVEDQYQYDFGDQPDQTDGLSRGDLQGVVINPYTLTKEFTSTPCTDVLDVVCRSAGWYWWVDAVNYIHISDQLPSEEFDLQWVLETSAGKQTKPWQSVVVIGGKNTSEGGEEASHQLAADPIRETAGEGEPVYTYTDKSIRTAEEAQAVADSILEEFQRQQAGGFIEIIGRVDIRPLDGVRLPQYLGGEAYIAGSIKHTLTNTDGFITRINCSGLLDRERDDSGQMQLGQEATSGDDGGTDGGGGGGGDGGDGSGDGNGGQGGQS